MTGGTGGLHVAIVGAGPAGFFTAGELLRVPNVRVDLFDRLPAPFGLVRHGVAPDHPDIKSVTGRYDREADAAGTRFRLLAHVEVGNDLTLPELLRRYHAVVLSFGAQMSRQLGIPGEELPGVHAASDFVGWYNGHPDLGGESFDVSTPRAVVIGVGNVALDVARILVKPLPELARTDMSDRALEALAHRHVREVVLLGRQGPAQSSFTPPELAELAEIDGCDLVVSDEDRTLDPQTEARRSRRSLDLQTERKLNAVARARHEPRPGRACIHVRFWTSPVEILGEEGHVTGVRVRRNAMAHDGGGTWALTPTDRTEVIACGLVFRSIGYRVQAFPGVPYDLTSGTIPHRRGQVMDRGASVPGLFVSGWAKRGARGVIGSNKPDAQETVKTLLEAWERGALPSPTAGDVEPLLESRGVDYVSYPDWKLLDSLEIEAGRAAGRPRRKFTDAPSMLRALADPHPENHGERVGNDG